MQVSFTITTLVVTTFIMMRVVHWNPLNSRADLINDDTTPTGGDMGAHVFDPAHLRDHLLPNWQLSGWSMDWYGGLPVYRFYMMVPALLIVALDTVLPYGAAFKYVVVLGSITLPFCCWAFGRLARFHRTSKQHSSPRPASGRSVRSGLWKSLSGASRRARRAGFDTTAESAGVMP